MGVTAFLRSNAGRKGAFLPERQKRRSNPGTR